MSLQTIFDDQIEKFRGLKHESDQIEKSKKDFDYKTELGKLESDRDNSINEVTQLSNLSENVKQQAIEAIKKEFLEKKDELDIHILNFDDELDNIRRKRANLRNDPTYKESLKARHDNIQAQKNLKKINDENEQAKSDLLSAEKTLEQAKIELELAQSKVIDIGSKLEKAEAKADNANRNYTKEISKMLTIKDMVINAVKYHIENGMVIKIGAGADESDIIKEIKKIIFSKIRVHRGKLADINDNIVQIDSSNMPIMLVNGDRFSVYCCLDELDANGHLVGGDVDIEIQMDEPSNSDEFINEGSKTSIENINITDVIEYTKRSNSNTHIAIMMKDAVLRGNVNITGLELIFKNLQTIYTCYQNREESLNLIFELDLPFEIIEKFIEYAAGKAQYHGKNLDIFLGIYNTISELRKDRKDKSNKSKREMKDIDLQILKYTGQAFGVNVVKDLGIDDIGKIGHILAGNCSGNMKNKRGKFRR